LKEQYPEEKPWEDLDYNLKASRQKHRNWQL